MRRPGAALASRRRSSISSIGKGTFATPGPDRATGAGVGLGVSRDVGGGGGGGARGRDGGMFGDPRPISTRAWQASTVAATVDYCLMSGYRAGPLSARCVLRPLDADARARRALAALHRAVGAVSAPS